MKRGNNGFPVAPNVTETELTLSSRLQASAQLAIRTFVPYWLSNNDKIATDIGEVDGK
jgi:hypothetical protein